MISFRLSSLLSICSLLSLGSLAAPTERQTMACNGYAALCDRQYSNVTFVGSHDSAFVGLLPTQNQGWSVATQLSNGVRFLQAQTHLMLGSLFLCHTSCLEEISGSLQEYLSTVKDFLDANPHEVVTLLLVNYNDQSPTMFDSIFRAAGLDSYAFVPSSSPNPLAIDSWPTLGDMISAGQRLVVFLDYCADESEVPYILAEFDYFFETPYDTTDPTFPECSINRPPGANATGRMYLVNHFLDISVDGVEFPDIPHTGKTNSPSGIGSIGAQVDICVGLYGAYPNVVLLDYIENGNFTEAQDSMNGV